MQLTKSFAALCGLVTLCISSVSAGGIVWDATSLRGQNFDYVVVGAGLTGLVVANRLSADPNVKVLVVEAGGDSRNNPKVYNMSEYGQAFGDTDLTYNFATTPQVGGRGKGLVGGKTLGGSTAINGAAWDRASKSQYDAWGTLVGGGNGWNWNDMERYMSKAEHFFPPGQAQQNLGARYDSNAHGFDGPLEINFSAVNGQQRKKRSEVMKKRMYSGPQQAAFIRAIGETLGVQQVDDLCSGQANAVAYTPNSIQTNGQRSSAATSYYNSVQNRDNLTLLLYTRAKNIVWDGQPYIAKANGVVVQQWQGPEVTINVNKEVVLAAGAINSPAILERSGVGSQAVIDRLGINSKLILDGVGKNLQDQTMTTMGAQGSINYSGGGPSDAIGMPNINQIMSNATDVRNYINNNLDSWADQMVSAGAASTKQGLLNQWKNAVSLIFDQLAPVVEFFFDTGYPSDSLGMDVWPLLPFSRGYAHAVSMDPFTDPEVNPNFFVLPIDMDIQVASLRSARRVFQNNNLRQLSWNGETMPGFGEIPDGPNHGRYDRWVNWIFNGGPQQSGFNAVSHQLGTAAMMPQEQGGVVDPNFKVYNTNNVRVVDASVLPTQLSAHLSATLYGVAEKAADAILGVGQ